MLVVLDIRYGLIQITVRINARSREAVLYFAEVLVKHRDPIFTDYNAFQLRWLDLLVPFVPSYIFDSEPFLRVCIEYFPNKILARFGNETGY